MVSSRHQQLGSTVRCAAAGAIQEGEVRPEFHVDHGEVVLLRNLGNTFGNLTHEREIQGQGPCATVNDNIAMPGPVFRNVARSRSPGELAQLEDILLSRVDAEATSREQPGPGADVSV